MALLVVVNVFINFTIRIDLQRGERQPDSTLIRRLLMHKMLPKAFLFEISSYRKIGPAAPPVKTSKGWLTTFHAVRKVKREIYAWHRDCHKIYYAGIMLLDLNNPEKIIGMSQSPLIIPDHPYELEGLRGEVAFPGGMILEDSGEVKIYYGAADTTECLAITNVDYLLKLCGV